MADKATLVLILFAGDAATTDQLDPFLKEIQDGINSLAPASRPDVFCFYQRLSVTGHQFAITQNTLTFTPDSQLDLTRFPPLGSRPVSGSLSSQVTAFLDDVQLNLAASGPVHVIVGAHGVSALGFHPTRFLRLAISLLFSPFNSELRVLKWRVRFRRLCDRIFLLGHPPGGIASGSILPDLSLDDTALALQKLKRLNGLMLHACNLSAVETMCALNTAEFHIACENTLSSWMRLSKWFSTLASPVATREQITTDCFDSMEHDPENALGCFSSHCVVIPDLLNCLNSLGTELCLLLNSSVSATATAAEIAVMEAQSKSGVRNYTIDVVRFCRVLSSNMGVPIAARDAAQTVALAVTSLQLRLIKTDEWKTSLKFQQYGGISLYLPLRNDEYYSPELLPKSLRTGAPEWFAFVKIWGGSAP